jgi:hypothetical protein
MRIVNPIDKLRKRAFDRGRLAYAREITLYGQTVGYSWDQPRWMARAWRLGWLYAEVVAQGRCRPC